MAYDTNAWSLGHEASVQQITPMSSYTTHVPWPGGIYKMTVLTFIFVLSAIGFLSLGIVLRGEGWETHVKLVVARFVCLLVFLVTGLLITFFEVQQ